MPATHATRRNPLFRVFDLFSSIAFGISVLAAILLYATIFSAVPSVCRALELGEMSAYQHWIFTTLIVLFMISITLVTIRRIRWTFINAGVLTVHSGLIILCLGCIWYFGTKIEGDVRLDAPRIEVITLAGAQSRQVAAVQAEKGGKWSGNMPALGGAVSIEVLGTSGEGLQPATKATVRAKVGDAPPTDVELSVGTRPLEAISERLAVRLIAPPPQARFYDDEVMALWYRPVGGGNETHRVAPIHHLPRHVERYLDEGYTLHDTSGREFPSKRSTPTVNLLGVHIPTCWLDAWRMPIRIAGDDLPCDVEVTGFLPYVGGAEMLARPGGVEPNPAVNLRMTFGRTNVQETLLANDPAASIGRQANVEFRWVSSIAERDALLRPLAGRNELEVEVLDPPVKRTYSIEAGQSIAVEGTSYELSVVELPTNWPLMTPGFEAARSPVARIDVVSPGKKYNRTVVARFPQLTQDIDEAGKRRTDGPYDPNLILRYRTAGNGSAMIVAGPNVPPQVGFFIASGEVAKFDITPGAAQSLDVGGARFSLLVSDIIANAEIDTLPIIVPTDARRPGLGRQTSAIRLRFTGRGDSASWQTSRWVIHSSYPDIEPAPIVVRIPGKEQPWEFIFSRLPIPLDAPMALQRLSIEPYPGETRASAWQSDVIYGNGQTGMTRTLETLSIGRWTFFQSGAATDNWSFTVLGVGNRNGIALAVVGCFMITLGCLFAFYVKPVLKKRQARQALELHEAKRRVRDAEPETELVGVQR